MNINCILFFLIICLSQISYSYAQNYSSEELSKLDSLNAIINDVTSHDTSIVNSYLELANYYYLQDIDTAIVFSSKAKEISDKINFIHGKAESNGWLGYLFDTKGDLEKALSYYMTALELHKQSGFKKGMSTNYSNIGYIYNSLGDIPLALDYFHKGLQINEELNDKVAIANSSINLGTIFYYQNDTENALKYYEKSLEILDEIGDKRTAAPCLNNVGLIYLYQDSISVALEYFTRSLDIEEGIGNTEGIATCYSNIGLVYIEQGDIEKGIEYYNLSLDLERELGNKRGVAFSLNNISKLYFDLGNYKLAYKYGIQSLELAEELGFPENIKSAAELLSKLYEKQNKGMEALRMHKLYIIMRDSINNIETQQASAQQQAKYTYEKQKSIDDATHEKQKALDRAESEKLLAVEREEKQSQRFIIYSASGGLILLIGFLLFVFNRLKVTNKQKEEINNQKLEIEKTHEQLAEHHKEISDSIVYAKSLQQAILPSREELNKELKNGFVLFQPKDVVSGDFYWMEKVGDIVFFAAADCTGHGVPGAMVSVVCSNALDRTVKEFGITETGKILDKVTELVVERFEKSGEDVKDGMDISLCAINWKTNELQYSGANNPLWVIRKRSEGGFAADTNVFSSTHYLKEYKANKQPIGKYEKRVPFKTNIVDIAIGDTLYLFTDGFADQFGGKKGKKYKYKPLKKLLLNIVELPPDQQQEKILDSFNTWKGDLEQIDDVCVIGVRI